MSIKSCMYSSPKCSICRFEGSLGLGSPCRINIAFLHCVLEGVILLLRFIPCNFVLHHLPCVIRIPHDLSSEYVEHPSQEKCALILIDWILLQVSTCRHDFSEEPTNKIRADFFLILGHRPSYEPIVENTFIPLVH